jgi:SAM-dependent methyltransferase
VEGIRRFDNRVADYDRWRPGYPDAVAGVLAEYGVRAPAHVADIGAGTGKLSEVFLRAGYRLTLIEPNDAMRAVADRALADRAASAGSIASVKATAEATGLPAASVDAIIAGQAFHWFEPCATRAEWRRILRPGAPVLLVWNDRRIQDSPLLAEHERLLLLHCPDYRELARTAPDESAVLAFLGGGDGAARGASVTRDPRARGAPRITSFEHAQDLTWEGLLGRVLSASYVPLEGPAHDALVAGMRAAFDHHQREGRVLLPYVTRVFHGTLA